MDILSTSVGVLIGLVTTSFFKFVNVYFAQFCRTVICKCRFCIRPHLQKMQKIFYINAKTTQKHAKTHARTAEQKTREYQRKNWKNGKNATTASGANDEQIITNGINAHRKLLLYIDLVQMYILQLQKMQMQILHSFALSYYANADFANVCIMYMYMYMYMYMILKE